jgi:hypothetical protein
VPPLSAEAVCAIEAAAQRAQVRAENPGHVMVSNSSPTPRIVTRTTLPTLDRTPRWLKDPGALLPTEGPSTAESKAPADVASQTVGDTIVSTGSRSGETDTDLPATDARTPPSDAATPILAAASAANGQEAAADGEEGHTACLPPPTCGAVNAKDRHCRFGPTRV